jgi:ABC-2 type transport system ATP-binding protein
MHQVEELCDRILLIDQGCALLHGELDSVRSRFSGNAIFIRTAASIPPIKEVLDVQKHNTGKKLILSPGSDPREILKQLIKTDIQIEWFEIAVPTLDEIFIEVVRAQGGK